MARSIMTAPSRPHSRRVVVQWGWAGWWLALAGLLCASCADEVTSQPVTGTGGGGAGVGGAGGAGGAGGMGNHDAAGGSGAAGGAGAGGGTGGGAGCLPEPEQCDGLDNDCNDLVDDELPAGALCDTGMLGVCAEGQQHCVAGAWSCLGVNQPADEGSCGDGLDNDCDGQVDEGTGCPSGYTVPCYSGPSNTQGVGECHDGIQTCTPPQCTWGPCENDQTPQPESCDGLDNDCDGLTDEGCAT